MSETLTLKIGQGVSVSINSKPSQRYTVIRIMDNIVTMAANELGDEVYNVMIKLHPTPASESDIRFSSNQSNKPMNNLKKLFKEEYLLLARDILSGDYDEEYVKWLENKIDESSFMEWIETDLQKPNFGGTKLVWCRIYGIFLATYEYIGDFDGEQHGNWRDFRGGLGILPPVYWMPLPELPYQVTESLKY